VLLTRGGTKSELVGKRLEHNGAWLRCLRGPSVLDGAELCRYRGANLCSDRRQESDSGAVPEPDLDGLSIAAERGTLHAAVML
jgi:hypothetical protein